MGAKGQTEFAHVFTNLISGILLLAVILPIFVRLYLALMSNIRGSSTGIFKLFISSDEPIGHKSVPETVI